MCRASRPSARAARRWRVAVSLLAAVWGLPWLQPSAAQGGGDSFDAFRQGLLNDYQSFRRQVLDDYSVFVGRVWDDYTAFRGLQRYPLPKPPMAPRAPEPGPEPAPPATPAPPAPKPVPVQPAPAPTGRAFSYYGARATLPDFVPSATLTTATDATLDQFWRALCADGFAAKVLPFIEQFAADHQLNDWLTVDFTRSYLSAAFPQAAGSMRTVMAYYLLLMEGYDVRLGLFSSGHVSLLVAFDRTVYNHGFYRLDGKMFYPFFDAADAHSVGEDESCHICSLAANGRGRSVGLLISKEPRLPFDAHSYRFSFGSITISGQVNANVMRMLYRYPNMQIVDYANSMVSRQVHNEVVSQVRQQLQGMSQLQALNALMHFVQKGFQYATDPDAHGFEKPYFFEETLFHPTCDCEDRSIFISYLMKYALGIDNVLIGYPDHEFTAARLDADIPGGTTFDYRGRRYYSVDPTYIGSSAGMCASNYRNKAPDEIQEPYVTP